jgi:hypothetical protein
VKNKNKIEYKIIQKGRDHPYSLKKNDGDGWKQVFFYPELKTIYVWLIEHGVKNPEKMKIKKR